MAKKGKGLGWWAFAVGLVLAVIFGYSGSVGLSWLLVLLGLVVGFLNISEKEAITFLVASIALMSSSAAANLTVLWGPLGNILGGVVTFVAPAAVVVAVKAVYETAQ
ncbi:hypothetical protein J4443_03010 [Candidatus Woesearchaeota archaeon]|nr:hypothetical protein [Candidatus Woesearchaeota archaeon]